MSCEDGGEGANLRTEAGGGCRPAPAGKGPEPTLLRPNSSSPASAAHRGRCGVKGMGGSKELHSVSRSSYGSTNGLDPGDRDGKSSELICGPCGRASAWDQF